MFGRRSAARGAASGGVTFSGADHAAARAAGVPRRESTTVRVVARVALDRARLVAELCRDGEVSFLHLQSRIEPGQSLLLPVRPVPLCAGLALRTPMGRIHALYWGLAYGCDDGSHEARVRFEATGRFADPALTVRPRWLADGYWVADAEGVFDAAVLVRGGDEITRVSLVDRW